MILFLLCVNMFHLWHALSHLNTEEVTTQHRVRRARMHFWSLFLAYGESSQSGSEKAFSYFRLLNFGLSLPTE